MKKVILPLIIIGLIRLSFVASAENFSLYGNLDDSNQYCNLLIDYYYNQDDFDPFYEYVVFQNEQYTYTLVYGKDLTGSDLKYIQYHRSFQSIPSSFTSGSIASLQLTTNNFSYVGNIQGSLSSNQFNEFKHKFIFISGGFVFMLFFLFKILRPRFQTSRSSKRYDL